MIVQFMECAVEEAIYLGSILSACKMQVLPCEFPGHPRFGSSLIMTKLVGCHLPVVVFLLDSRKLVGVERAGSIRYMGIAVDRGYGERPRDT